MIRSILVPLDGSPFSEHALPLAAGIAHRTGAAIELVRVHEPLLPPLGVETASAPGAAISTVPPIDPRLEEERRRAHESYLRSVAERVGAESGGAVATRLLNGSPVQALAAHVAERGADLVVMTTHGRSGLNRLWLGSVAEGLVRHVAAPVLLVKPGEQGPPAPPFRRVLLPLDSSPLAESVIEPAIEVAGANAVEYTLVRVTEPLTALSEASFGAVADARRETRERQENQTDDYLESLAVRLRARGLDVRVRCVVHVHAARAILETAGDIGADLIAMATHGRGGLRRLLLGSVADTVLRGAETSVLLYRPAQE